MEGTILVATCVQIIFLFQLGPEKNQFCEWFRILGWKHPGTLGSDKFCLWERFTAWAWAVIPEVLPVVW